MSQKNAIGFDAQRSRLHWHFKQASLVIEAYFFFLVFSSIECERRIETMKKGMLERLSNMPFSVGWWKIIYSSSKKLKCLLPSSSPLSTVVVGFEDETSVPEVAIND